MKRLTDRSKCLGSDYRLLVTRTGSNGKCRREIEYRERGVDWGPPEGDWYSSVRVGTLSQPNASNKPLTKRRALKTLFNII